MIGNRKSSPGQRDDWFAGDDEFDWPQEPGDDDGTAVGVHWPQAETVERSPATPPVGPRRDEPVFVRRRRILVAAVLGLAVAAAVGIALATAGSRHGTSAFAPPATTTGAASANVTPPPPAPTQTPTTASGTTKPRTSTSLRVSLPSDGPLSTGDNGPAVVKLQKALASLGYKVTADGDFGTGTETAVRAFQNAHGLTADGAVGSATVKKLNQALASG